MPMAQKIAINLAKCSLLGLFAFLSIQLSACCNQESCDIEPDIFFCAPPQIVESLPSAFPDLSSEEIKEDWGKELLIAYKFARENDLYRAITAFKRALILIPPGHKNRQQQIEYNIILSYYLGEKYQEAVEFFEKSSLIAVSTQFMAFDNLLQILYDSYNKVNQSAKAEKVYEFIEKVRPEMALHLRHAEDVINADFFALQGSPFSDEEDFKYFIESYSQNAESVSKAKMLNAILPGAGYYYIGQKNTAITAFVINSLFIAAAYYFFD